MKYNTTIELKDGRSCIIRNAVGEDAAAVKESFDRTHRETDFLLSYPDESSLTVDQEKEFLIIKENSPNSIELCAVVDGRIVGTAGIASLGIREKLRHRAEMGISVEKDYWGLGIGRAMIAASIECAENAGYRQLELTAVAENGRALRLYESMGFVEYGRNPRGFCSRISGWQEIVLMRLEIDREEG